MLIKTESPEETEKLGIKFAEFLKPGDIVFFEGDLGSGKTTFIRGLVKGLGSSSLVTSPTFTFLNLYNGRFPIYHFDLYRLSIPHEFSQIGCEDCFCGDGVVLLEWPQNAAPLIPLPNIRVTLEFSFEDNSRSVSFTCGDAARLSILEGMLVHPGMEQ